MEHSPGSFPGYGSKFLKIYEIEILIQTIKNKKLTFRSLLKASPKEIWIEMISEKGYEWCIYKSRWNKYSNSLIYEAKKEKKSFVWQTMYGIAIKNQPYIKIII